MENFDAASNVAVGMTRRSGGNHWAMDFELGGKVGASPMPSSSLEANSRPMEGATEAKPEAPAHRSTAGSMMRRTPKRSSREPEGTCRSALLHLLARRR